MYMQILYVIGKSSWVADGLIATKQFRNVALLAKARDCDRLSTLAYQLPSTQNPPGHHTQQIPPLASVLPPLRMYVECDPWETRHPSLFDYPLPFQPSLAFVSLGFHVEPHGHFLVCYLLRNAADTPCSEFEYAGDKTSFHQDGRPSSCHTSARRSCPLCLLLKSHVHPAQYVDGVRTSMQYLQTTCSVDLVIVLFRVDNTCHRSYDLVTRHTLCCI